MILDIPAVMRDGTVPAGTIAPAVPTAFPIVWPRGEDGTLRLTVTGRDHAPIDLTGASVTFGVRRYPNDEEPQISRHGTIIDEETGRVDVVLVQGDTLGLDDDHEYFYDVQLTDVDGNRWQIVPPSAFRVGGVYAHPEDESTVPIGTWPLSQGPSWLEESWPPEVVTDATTAEQLSPNHELVWNFDDGAVPWMATLFARLAALARVSGGTGTIRARWGGSAGVPDGTPLLEVGPVTATAYALVSVAATVVRPTGTQLVKVTLQNDTAGQRTYLRALSLRARAS